MPPKKPEGRNYADLNLRNPFVGAVPPVVITKKEKPKDKDDTKETTQAKPSVNVMQYLKFEGFSGVQQDDEDKREVFLHNLLQPLSGKNAYVTLTSNKSFVILDVEGKKPVLKGKVLSIDQRHRLLPGGRVGLRPERRRHRMGRHVGGRQAARDDEGENDLAMLPRSRLEELGLQKLLEPVEKGEK